MKQDPQQYKIEWDVQSPTTPERIRAESHDNVIQLRKHINKLSLNLDSEQLSVAVAVLSFLFMEEFSLPEIEMARDILFDAKTGIDGR